MKKLSQKNVSYFPKFTQLEKKNRAPASILKSKARLSDFNTGWDLFIIVEEEGEKSCVETH